jgi:hypothetical protein
MSEARSRCRPILVSSAPCSAISAIHASRRDEEIQCQNLASSKLTQVLGGQRIVLGQNARLEGEHLSGVFMIIMFMSRRVAAMGSLCMDMAMVVAVSIAKRMLTSVNMARAVPRAVGMDVLRLVAINPAIGVLMPCTSEWAWRTPSA